MAKDRAPRLKEQFKDDVAETDRKHTVAAAELQKKLVQHKIAELDSDPRRKANWSEGCAEGVKNG